MRTNRPISPVLPGRRAGLVWAAVLAVAVALLGPTGSARAATDIEEVAAALRETPVYVDPAASDKLSAAEADRLAGQIRAGDVPVYVAVLPDDASYEGDAVFDRLRSEVDRPGVYAVALGSRFGAASDSAVLRGATASSLAQRNLREHPNDPYRILSGFVTDVQSAARDGGAGYRDRGPAGGGSGGGGGVLVGFLVVLAVFALGGLFLTRRSHRRQEQEERAELEQVRAAVDEDITAYGERLDRLDFSPSAPGVTQEMLTDYEHALDAYEKAKQASAAARRPDDMRAVTEALEDGRFSLAVLDARREGRELPERRPPCFFDPRHGPSVRDVEWTPPGGAPREVPVCAADATRVEDGLDPAVRTVPTATGERVPYWDAGPAYGPWMGGYYGAYGSMLLPGLLFGTVLGSSLGGWGYGYGPGWGYGGEGGYSGDSFGGGFGGGDFGGGFGGGGFGGDGGF
ncbi:hypothetical protein V1L54_12645 [Streptomyces sp. TRM 70361]|uniref:hypothetical protein n=1 Tax=Streptomyces sp. TRM 70361 TaxID=3116553 RepID=UPI002E7C55FC|nr:hypothetical protein [Streptomyces sp. TRM 70361]MEE1940240.1 hypothetical protein [Streptomyces sp. TRM 70361]